MFKAGERRGPVECVYLFLGRCAIPCLKLSDITAVTYKESKCGMERNASLGYPSCLELPWTWRVYSTCGGFSAFVSASANRWPQGMALYLRIHSVTIRAPLGQTTGQHLRVRRIASWTVPQNASKRRGAPP